MFTHVISCVSTSLIVFFLINYVRYDIYCLNHLKCAGLWHERHLHCCADIHTICLQTTFLN